VFKLELDFVILTWNVGGLPTAGYANKFPSNELEFHNFGEIDIRLLRDEYRFAAAEV